jgi:phage shock protein B
MEWGILVPLAPFLMVLGIVWITKHSRLEEKRIAATTSQTAEQAAQYASKVQQLEDRIQVLERIVTDRGYDVATQIEALRDQRRVDEQDSGVPLNMARKENV